MLPRLCAFWEVKMEEVSFRIQKQDSDLPGHLPACTANQVIPQISEGVGLGSTEPLKIRPTLGSKKSSNSQGETNSIVKRLR